MKKKFLLVASSLSALLFVSASAFLIKEKDAVKVEAYTTSSLPTTIDLNDSSESEIRAYYSSLNDLSSSERQGTNLLKNLKPILKNGQKYYSYDSGSSIWKMYEITDRDWDKSPASEINGYNSSTNKINGYTYGTNYASPGTNPYLHALYVDRNTENLMRAWKKDNDTYNRNNHGQNAEWYIDREHIWPKSAGFETSGAGGARGDPMHLWPGDSAVNSEQHSNYFYGNVKTISSVGKWSYASSNKMGSSSTFSSYSSINVFEPQDSDKGDIARACFYMVARYNYLSGSDSDGIDSNNPNLELVNNVTDFQSSGYESTTTNTGKLGILQDLLEWNRLDPPDEWEIHRNNLCYNNFTNNRNPFIDFPEWAEYIWGKSEGGNYSSEATGYAAPNSDYINTFSEDGGSSGGDDIVKSGTYTLGWGTATGDIGTYSNFTETSGTVTGLLSFSSTKNDSATNPAYNSSNNELRLYYNSGGNGGSVTITPEEGVTITGAVVTTSTSPNVSYYVDGGTAQSVNCNDNTYTISDISASSSLEIKNVNTSNTQLRIRTIQLTYTSDGSTVPTSISASVDKTYYVGETIAASDIIVEDNLGNTITDFIFANNNYQFTYDDAASGGILTNKIFTDAISYNNMTCSLTVQVQRKAYIVPELISDTLSSDYTGQSGNTYGSWSSKAAPNSNAYYAGNNAGNYSSIQLRSSDNAGIVSTTSGGILDAVSVTWNSNTVNGRTLNIYGKKSAYTSPSDLYDPLIFGTLLGTIVCGASIELNINGSYAYIGIRSNSGALYLTDITISYKNDTAINVANYIMYEDTDGQCDTKFDIAKGYFEGLSVSERALFMTSSDYVIQIARERFEAWARNKGVDIAYLDNDYAFISHLSPLSFSNGTNILISIITIISAFGLVAIIRHLVYKKETK